MNALWALLLALAFALPGNSQLATRDTLTKLLGFENGQPGRPPLGWGNNPTNTAFIDGQIQHSGKYSAGWSAHPPAPEISLLCRRASRSISPAID